MEQQPEQPFDTDGCSGGMTWLWNIFFKTNPPWQDCCVLHDIEYWQGGSEDDRWNSDVALYNCVKAKGHPIWAILIFIGVRLGGHPFFPTRFRWGYGRKYPSRYFQRTKRFDPK